MTGTTLFIIAAFLYLSVWSYENIALHQPAWQSSTVLPYTGAERAVDGLYSNLSVHGRQCAVSDNNHTTAEWRVDLGRVLSIHHVFLQFMTHNRVWDKDNIFAWWVVGFSVHISNTPNKEDGVLCFKDIDYIPATIPSSINITCPYHGRYVIYYNNRTHPPYPEGYYHQASIALCEVEVYGCSSPVYYGDNCSFGCPGNCKDGYCDIVNGSCLACRPGYLGPRCNMVLGNSDWTTYPACHINVRFNIEQHHPNLVLHFLEGFRR